MKVKPRKNLKKKEKIIVEDAVSELYNEKYDELWNAKRKEFPVDTV